MVLDSEIIFGSLDYKPKLMKRKKEIKFLKLINPLIWQNFISHKNKIYI